MRIKDLIERLEALENPEGTAYLMTKKAIHDFSGCSTDENNDVLLYVAYGDAKAADI